ncbi:MAG: PAS domain S-box protein [Coriobacteriia bacterium]|nr:PAS domain S-box protein [Coriobacteriia bacterium]
MLLSDINLGDVSARLGDMIFLVSPDKRILDVSESALRTYGYSIDEFRGMTVLEIRDSDEVDLVDRQVEQALHGGVYFEARHRRKDGTRMLVEVSSAPVEKSGERALISVVRDITRSARVRDLADQRSLLARTQSEGHIGNWRFDLVNREASVSDEACRLHGVDPAQVHGSMMQAIQGVIHPADRASFEQQVMETERTGFGSVTYRVMLPEGGMRWILATTERVDDADGVPIEVHGFIQDVTETRDAESAVLERTLALDSLLDAITESAFLLELDGTIIALNEVSARRLGAEDPALMIGRSIYDFVPPELASQRREYIAQVAATGMPVSFEDQRDGRRILNSLAPVKIRGEVVQIAVFGYDVTDAREAEDALRESEYWLREAQRIARLGHFAYDPRADCWSGSPILSSLVDNASDGHGTLALFLTAIHRDDRDWVEAQLRDSIDRCVGVDIECRANCGEDPAECWIHMLAECEADGAGSTKRVFGTIQDVTERKRAELVIAAERARLAQVESIGHVGSWRLDLVTGQGEWSDEYKRVLGFDPASRPGNEIGSFIDYVHPDDREPFMVDDLLEPWGTDAATIDFRVTRPDGETRWMATNGRVERDRSGRPIAIVGVLQDITGRKLSELAHAAELEEAANSDRLTGLYNRRAYDVLADGVLAAAAAEGIGIGLIYCDVDGLKSINDEFGHAQGDRALKDASGVLSRALRSADLIARIGGDEFLVLVKTPDADMVRRLDERLQSALELFNATNDRPYLVEASSGFAWSRSSTRPELDELEKSADARMYAIKNARREAPGASQSAS